MLSAADLLSHVDRITDPVALVDRILRAGLLMRASDVHFDPFESFVRVRFRIDGELEEVLRIPSSMQGALTGRLKVLSAMDIAEKRAPQDGGFTWRMNVPCASMMSALLLVHSMFSPLTLVGRTTSVEVFLGRKSELRTSFSMFCCISC